MLQPESLRSDAYQPWLRGRGVDVWAMLCASITGDLQTIRELVARDPNLVDCEYEYLKPIRFAVRENHRAVVDFLLEKGADAAYEAGDSLVRIASDRGYTELGAFLESKLNERYGIVPEAAAVSRAIVARDLTQVSKGANPHLPEDESWAQPLEWAKRRGRYEIAEMLQS